MSTTLDRGELTDFLLTYLDGEVEFAVGDGEAPKNAGWVGDPNAPASQFVPYLVLASQLAQRSQGSFGDPQDTWQVPYSLSGVGAARAQADWIVQRGLDTLSGLKKQKLQLGPGPKWKVLEVTSTALGGVRRSDGTEPPFWQRDDGLSFFITKELI